MLPAQKFGTSFCALIHRGSISKRDAVDQEEGLYELSIRRALVYRGDVFSRGIYSEQGQPDARADDVAENHWNDDTQSMYMATCLPNHSLFAATIGIVARGLLLLSSER
jgi:hypothetical protein